MRRLFTLLMLLGVVGCHERKAPDGRTAPAVAIPRAVHGAEKPAGTALNIERVSTGDAEHGKALIVQYECHRCHDGTGHAPIARDKHCVHCHQDILADKFEAPRASLEKWQKTVADYQAVPSLEATAQRLRADWLLAFLRQPDDLRPHLVSSMPRLAFRAADAADIVAYLTQNQRATLPPELRRGDQRLGRRLLESRGCGACHELAGADLPLKPKLEPGNHLHNRAIMLAPDLGFVRQRYRPDKLVSWLMDPASVKADTLMPATGLRRSEAESVASYLLFARLVTQSPPALPRRLALLTRRVSYAEVDEKVFRVTCRHCHSNPDIALGDGGPGNTGGFGFQPRGLNLSSFAAVNSGYKDAAGERHSIFEALSDGTPRIVASVLARQSEERGKPSAEVRGMPLGLPSLRSEQVQLLESWVAQGRPR